MNSIILPDKTGSGGRHAAADGPFGLFPPGDDRIGEAAGRLVFATDGAALAAGRRGLWLAPSGHLLWLPPGLPLALRGLGGLPPRRLALAPGMAAQLSATPFVIGLSALLRAAMEKYLDLEGEAPATAPRRRLLGVIMDEVEGAEPVPFALPLAGEPRIEKVTEALLRDPADRRRLEDFAGPAGTSPRTLARLFPAATGLTFGQWRDRLRLVSALTLLGAGNPVAEVAAGCGFSSASAFIAFFRRRTGRPPGQFRRRNRRAAPSAPPFRFEAVR